MIVTVISNLIIFTCIEIFYLTEKYVFIFYYIQSFLVLVLANPKSILKTNCERHSTIVTDEQALDYLTKLGLIIFVINAPR